MKIAKLVFLALLGLFALAICILAVVVFFARIIYLIGVKQGRWPK